MANGCGIFGIYSITARIILGRYPPFHCACIDHDNEYATLLNEGEREEADYVLRAEIEAKGCDTIAKIFFWIVRKFGKIAITKRNFIRRIKR